MKSGRPAAERKEERKQFLVLEINNYGENVQLKTPHCNKLSLTAFLIYKWFLFITILGFSSQNRALSWRSPPPPAAALISISFHLRPIIILKGLEKKRKKKKEQHGEASCHALKFLSTGGVNIYM